MTDRPLSPSSFGRPSQISISTSAGKNHTPSFVPDTTGSGSAASVASSHLPSTGFTTLDPSHPPFDTSAMSSKKVSSLSIPYTGGPAITSSGPDPTSATAQSSSSTAVTPVSTTNSSTRRYRVPDDLRRRAAVSCDRCKLRRARCVRADGQETCSNCARHGSPCVSTLPRKHRIYGSLESLSLRFRALEALVRGLFPEENTQDVATLFKIANDRNVSHLMPPPDQLEFASGIFDQKPRSSTVAETSISPFTPAPGTAGDGATGSVSITALSTTPIDRNTGLALASTSLPPAPASLTSPTNVNPTSPLSPSPAIDSHSSRLSDYFNTIPRDPSESNSTLPSFPPANAPPSSAKSTSTVPTFLAVDEQLVTTPQGLCHYIGPTSTFGFAASVRIIVARCALAPRCRLYRRDVGAALAQLHSITAGNRTQRGDGPQGATPSKEGGMKTQKDGDATSKMDEKMELRKKNWIGMGLALSMPGDGANSSSIGAETTANGTAQASALYEGRGPEYNAESVPSSNMAALFRELLPPRADADRLINSFFEYVHPCCPVFLRSSFTKMYESVWREGAIPLHPVDDSTIEPGVIWKDDPGWMCCIILALLFGADALAQHTKEVIRLDRRMASLLLRSFLLSKILLATSLVNTQALYLLHIYEHNAGERNLSWVILGNAVRMAMAIGMHRNLLPSAFGRDEYEVRRRVWWTLYLSESLMSVILGRPSSISDSEVTVGMPDEAFFGDDDTPPGFLEHAIRLSRILTLIRTELFGPTALRARMPDGALARHYLNALENWHSDLPPVLLPKWNSMRQCHRRMVLLLHIHFTFAKCLVTRPFFMRRAETIVSELEKPGPTSGQKTRSKTKPRPESRPDAGSAPARSKSDDGGGGSNDMDMGDELEDDQTDVKSDGAVGETESGNDFSIAAALATLPPSIRSDVTSLAKVCVRSAEQASTHLIQMMNSGLLDCVSGLDGYFVYHAVFILALDVLARGTSGPSSAASQSTSSPATGSALSPDEKAHRAVMKAVMQTVHRFNLGTTFRLILHVAAQLVAMIEASGSGNTVGTGGIRRTNMAHFSSAQQRPGSGSDTGQDTSQTGKPDGSLASGATQSTQKPSSQRGKDVQIVNQPAMLDIFPAAYVAAPWDYFHLFGGVGATSALGASSGQGAKSMPVQNVSRPADVSSPGFPPNGNFKLGSETGGQAITAVKVEEMSGMDPEAPTGIVSADSNMHIDSDASARMEMEVEAHEPTGPSASSGYHHELRPWEQAQASHQGHFISSEGRASENGHLRVQDDHQQILSFSAQHQNRPHPPGTTGIPHVQVSLAHDQLHLVPSQHQHSMPLMPPNPADLSPEEGYIFAPATTPVVFNPQHVHRNAQARIRLDMCDDDQHRLKDTPIQPHQIIFSPQEMEFQPQSRGPGPVQRALMAMSGPTVSPSQKTQLMLGPDYHQQMQDQQAGTGPSNAHFGGGEMQGQTPGYGNQPTYQAEPGLTLSHSNSHSHSSSPQAFSGTNHPSMNLRSPSKTPGHSHPLVSTPATDLGIPAGQTGGIVGAIDTTHHGPNAFMNPPFTQPSPQVPIQTPDSAQSTFWSQYQQHQLGPGNPVGIDISPGHDDSTSHASTSAFSAAMAVPAGLAEGLGGMNPLPVHHMSHQVLRIVNPGDAYVIGSNSDDRFSHLNEIPPFHSVPTLPGHGMEQLPAPLVDHHHHQHQHQHQHHPQFRQAGHLDLDVGPLAHEQQRHGQQSHGPVVWDSGADVLHQQQQQQQSNRSSHPGGDVRPGGGGGTTTEAGPTASREAHDDVIMS